MDNNCNYNNRECSQDALQNNSNWLYNTWCLSRDCHRATWYTCVCRNILYVWKWSYWFTNAYRTFCLLFSVHSGGGSGGGDEEVRSPALNPTFITSSSTSHFRFPLHNHQSFCSLDFENFERMPALCLFSWNFSMTGAKRVRENWRDFHGKYQNDYVWRSGINLPHSTSCKIVSNPTHTRSIALNYVKF